MKPPISYYGGKQRMVSKIVPLIPRHTIDRQKVATHAIRCEMLKSMIDDGLLTVEEGLALINGTPIRPRPWWVRVWRWVRRGGPDCPLHAEW